MWVVALTFTCCRMSSMLLFNRRFASSRSPWDMAVDRAFIMAEGQPPPFETPVTLHNHS